MSWVDGFFCENNNEIFWKEYWTKNFFPQYYSSTTTTFDGDVYEDFDLYEEITKAKKDFNVECKVSVISIKIKKPNVVVTVKPVHCPNVLSNPSYGIARCSDKDLFSISKGMKIALRRAIKNLSEELECQQ